MVLHPLLKRQLRRIGLQEDKIPTAEEWQNILERINRTYLEADQERYLHEIAIEVSSRETSELNKKFEYAQHIAHLGYWYYDKESGQMIWSKEMYSLFNCDPAHNIPSYEEIMLKFEDEDRNLLSNLIAHAFSSGEGYELEAKLKNEGANKDRWLYLAGQPYQNHSDKSTHSLSGIAMDITRRKDAEDEMHKLNQQLMSSARRAGMAEIATSVLHNIGNVLNSVNISSGLIQTYLQELDIPDLIQAIQMIEDNISSLDIYLTKDPRGKMLPKYFQEAKKVIDEKNQQAFMEIKRLNEHINHIKDIVAMQNTLSGISKMVETTCLPELIDSVLHLNEETLNKNHILIEKNYQFDTPISADKNKIMQILINLIQNAKDALITADPNLKKQLSVSTQLMPDKEYVEIRVADTGIGILPENIDRIFSFGFTTKAKGHGFGLHSSALLAKELGGGLTVTSKGIGHGTVFTMTIPFVTQLNRSVSHEREI